MVFFIKKTVKKYNRNVNKRNTKRKNNKRNNNKRNTIRNSNNRNSNNRNSNKRNSNNRSNNVQRNNYVEFFGKDGLNEHTSKVTLKNKNNLSKIKTCNKVLVENEKKCNCFSNKKRPKRYNVYKNGEECKTVRNKPQCKEYKQCRDLFGSFMSNSEPDYRPEDWKDPLIEGSHNCYAYFLDDQIDKVKILNGGSDYTSASITFINANGVSNTDANFDVIIPPTGGHGSDAIKELGGFFIMINTRFQYNEYDFPVDNDYRQISLIRHPKKSDGTDATDDAYVQCKTLVVSVSNIDETSGSLGSDQILSQDQGGGKIVKATIVDVLDDSVNNNKKIRIVGSSEDFSLSTPLSSSSGVIINSIESIEGIGLMEDSGDVIFVEQRKSIQRDASQVEDIKIILEF